MARKPYPSDVSEKEWKLIEPILVAALFPTLPERLQSMGISPKLFEEADYDYNSLIDRIQNDNQFDRTNQLESLRETLTM